MRTLLADPSVRLTTSMPSRWGRTLHLSLPRRWSATWRRARSALRPIHSRPGAGPKRTAGVRLRRLALWTLTAFVPPPAQRVSAVYECSRLDRTLKTGTHELRRPVARSRGRPAISRSTATLPCTPQAIKWWRLMGTPVLICSRHVPRHWCLQVPRPGYVQQRPENVDDGFGGLLLSPANPERSVKLLCGSIGDH